MRFDDRLATVLDQPAADMRGRAVQWRQLVELVARGQEISPALRDRALERIAALMQDLPDDLLAATARAIASRFVPAELVALFAARGATASAALLTAAELDGAGWHAVRAVAASDVLPLVKALEPATDPLAAEPATEPALAVGSTSEPSALVQVAAPIPRTESEPAEPAPLPAGLFRWETGPTGEIDWIEGAPRAALIGRSLVESFADPFAARLPFADEPLVLADDGALAGEWRWSGSPAFFPDTGRFAGYRGFAKREGVASEAGLAIAAPAADDGLRELMHELRTPLNAIIGFGEIIEGQYLGPAHRAYRERAAIIVRQARRLADAVDNLDLAAKLRSGREQGKTVSEPDLALRVLERLRTEATARDIDLVVEERSAASSIALQPQLAERLLQQFGEAMLEPVVAGERIRLVVERRGDMLAFAMDRATALLGLTEQRLLADRGQGGMRFTLRLVQGLGAMVGSGLDIAPERLTLLLPAAR